jgi:16S rRNA (guanine527-N7)-methyltransferase
MSDDLPNPDLTAPIAATPMLKDSMVKDQSALLDEPAATPMAATPTAATPIATITPEALAQIWEAQFGRWQETLDWQPNPRQQALFQQLYQTIVTANQQLNLTRITEPTEFWEKHLWDSLRGVKAMLWHEAPQSLIDIGTGAGFPGLPIAIACPQWKLTLLDSTRKKINFVQQAAAALGLKPVKGLSDRVEALGQQRQYRETYDIATIRAVAAASVCAEYALPMVKVGGMAILYRGQWGETEGAELASAVAELGGVIDRVETFETPLTQGARACVYLRNVARTDDYYPRPVGIPAQQPL